MSTNTSSNSTPSESVTCRFYLLLINDEDKILAIPEQDSGFKLKGVPHTIEKLGDNPQSDNLPDLQMAKDMALSLTGVRGFGKCKKLLLRDSTPDAATSDRTELIVIACRTLSQQPVRFPWQWMHRHSLQNCEFSREILDDEEHEYLVKRFSAFLNGTNEETDNGAIFGCMPTWEGLKKLFW